MGKQTFIAMCANGDMLFSAHWQQTFLAAHFENKTSPHMNKIDEMANGLRWHRTEPTDRPADDNSNMCVCLARVVDGAGADAWNEGV